MPATVTTPVGRLPVLPVLLIAVGGYLAWFGVHYFEGTRPDGSTLWPTDPVKAALTGKPLQASKDQSAGQIASSVAAGAPGGPPLPPGTSGGVATGNVISTDAMRYQGQGYVWGGRADIPGDWDCSSFVSYVLGHDLGMQLPGGGKYGDAGYPPHAHGPTTHNYMLFGVGVNAGSEQPGDLVVSNVHMGIIIGGGKMISAQDPQLGTGIAGYRSGFPGGSPQYRRVSVPAVQPPGLGKHP